MPESPPRGFAINELAGRVATAQRLMKRDGFDALLLTNEPEFRYYSGFLTQFWQSPTRPWFLVVPADGGPVAVIPGIGEPLMRRTWVEDVRTWPSPQPEDEGVSLLTDTLRSLGCATGRVGVPMGPETLLRMPLTDYERLRAALPQAEWGDATPLVREQRMVKSDAELAKLRHICSLASDAFDAVPGLVHRGQPLDAVFGAFRIALLQAGADAVPYLVGAADQGGYADVISPPGERGLRAGDVLMMDTGAIHDGYFCDFDRNYAIGAADTDARQAYDTLYCATEAGLRAARPGATCSQLFRAMGGVIADAGYAVGNVGRMGHGLGMQLTEWPSHRPGDDTVLAPGMALTLEPALTIAPGRTMVHEENLIVRDGPPELLSRRAPPELPVVA